MSAASWLNGAAAARLTEGLLSVLKEQRPEFLPGLLENYRQHGVFRSQGSSTVGGLLGFSNVKMASSKTKFEGLCLLSMLVQDSSSELFQQHCLSWLRSLQQVIQSQAPVQTVQLAVFILQDLLQYSSQLPELAREVGLNCILGILTSLLGLKTECELAAMEGMTACMTYYPRACGSLRDKLGAYFLSKMDSTNKKTQEMACRCYGRLPCLGGLTDRAGAGRADRWTDQVHCLLASANAVLSHLYRSSEADRTGQYEGPGMELGFPHLNQSDALLPLQLQHRYTAVCLALKHTLSVDPSSAVRLPVRPVLNLVCRALAISAKSINLTGDGSVRLLLLPAVHIGTLEVLTALFTVVRTSMVQYAAVLQRLFAQTLSAWTPPPEASPGQQRAYCLVRVSVYKSLEAWVQVAGASAGILQGSPSHTELLYSHLLDDITPGAESVKLRAGLLADVVPGGKPGPRRTKPLVMADAVGPSLQRKGDTLANQDTCLAALRALRQIILTSGTLLKDDLHKRLHEVLLPLCVRLQQQQSSCSAAESAAGVSGQYGGALTRRELYRLLLALVLVPSPSWPPPLTCGVSIFSRGRMDRNLKVSSFCAEALTVCNSLVHPRAPSIAIPLPPLTLKAATSASVLPSSQGPTPGLPLPTLLGGPGATGPFPARHSLGLLGSLENHLSLVPGHASGDMILSPHAHQQPEPAGLGPPEGQRPIFVRYDKEEDEDAEISLDSDSDDSVVIVPPGMLTAEAREPVETSAAPPQTPAVAPAPSEPAAVAPVAMDAVSLPNDLAAASSPLPSAPINSFAPPASSVVTHFPLGAAGAGETPAARPQLQQMLMQPAPPGGLGLQMHQLQNQLAAPQGRLPSAASNEDSAVININSTDEEEEDMEDDEELEDEDEEEEGSDFPEGEFYEGEEFDEFDEEGEEEEEEDEEEDEDEEDGDVDGEMPPLEGAEDNADVGGIEEEKVMRVEPAPPAADGEAVGGIQEVRLSRGEERGKVQEVECIGVLEGAREDEEEDSERMDDPTMPQILCVTGGALEEREEPSSQEEEDGLRQDPPDVELQPEQQDAASTPALELSVADDQPPVLQNELLVPSPEAGAPPPSEPATLSGPEERPEEEDCDKDAVTEGGGDDEEGDQAKGVKRKRDDENPEEEAGPSTDKEKMQDDAIASMLADFVPCPPNDDEVAGSGSCKSVDES
ncbi:proline-, glutamic acid- and leucine-rich protein 1 [Corythoichthys intestinalis]|uniref:proline-, glutamic acid- and leucine-rich protein 1 n=1 Tax=Corythoichthys intestinalis TaxID=161448 RepID=UPI0025A50FD6|nr:proline-, glutamic acid- and leucine-rich protein 1 [Corythoichthys intestinalis]XP_061810607.1 proline-, glutamic acid- and leucine-rich protein 1-like [Nerophis lumbriciformis]